MAVLLRVASKATTLHLPKDTVNPSRVVSTHDIRVKVINLSSLSSLRTATWRMFIFAFYTRLLTSS